MRAELEGGRRGPETSVDVEKGRREGSTDLGKGVGEGLRAFFCVFIVDTTTGTTTIITAGGVITATAGAAAGTTVVIKNEERLKRG